MKKENKHSNFKLTKNLKNNGAFKVPVGYFDSIEDGIIAQVKAEKLNVTSDKNAFKTPKNYFNSVEDIVIAKLKAEVLNKTKTDNQIPNDYFNSFEDSILSKIKPENKSKVIPLKSRILKYMAPIAIAASFLLIIVLNNNSKTLSFDSLASDDIVNYFENDNATFDPLTVASLYTESELDNETISAAITNDEVVDYLSEEDLEQITYEN